MCTVTLVPHPESLSGFILTSNRDEAVGRKTLPPAWERYNEVKLYFPKDKLAGGTWLGVSKLSRCICLMNGGEEPHVRKKDYRKSRGIVVKEFLAADKLKNFRSEYNYEGIEPFTMIIVEWHNGLSFQELIWDGEEVKFSHLPLKEHIWSSSPLYSQEMKSERIKWFNELKTAGGFSSENLLDFHYSAGKGNKEYGLIIDRGFLKTQSISQIVNLENELKFSYENLHLKESHEEYLAN
ncbi:NRDE family protein [Christiangramia aquimixticola]|uniref:NRDE family protein n=1 Tax=Christiangramia aquimixticola TaxID=1697558 RepID=UPI003AA7BD93